MCGKIQSLMKIYFDACCLNRPFDDHVQDRVRLESEAVLTIFTQSKIKNWLLLNSEVIDIEISKIPDSDKRQKVGILSSLLKPLIIIDENVERRAMTLEDLGFESYDALHIACAEKGKTNILLTTDDKFLNKGFQYKDILKVRVENPVKWFMEVIGK
jgi:predicted nucleic acid-binding protein